MDLRDRPPYPRAVLAAVLRSSLTPRPWVFRSDGQGLGLGRSAGRVDALHLSPEAAPELGPGRLDHDGDLPPSKQHAGCGLEEERAKALPAEFRFGGSPQE